MTLPIRSRSLRLVAAAAIAYAVGACASNRPTVRNAELLAPPKDICELAREDAALDPYLDVERVPTPLKMDPPPIRTPVPRSALRRDGSSSLKVEVLVDTLGKPVMSTFKMIESTSGWLTYGVKQAISKWTFEPALRNGCKVPRMYQFSASSPPRR